MNLELRYWGRSGSAPVAGGAWALSFAPNLARPKVFFDQALKHPLRFREAISALHEVVVGDLRRAPRDRTAYRAWLAEQARDEAALARLVSDRTAQARLQALAREPVRPGLEDDFRRYHQLYWTARRQWAAELQRSDPALFRSLVPCDPVVTVAPDSVFFECFARDESSYGCLYVDRDAFLGAGDAALGTTNVDYSLGLYEHFQTLRTYRPTRLLVDPTGFAVKTGGASEVREEKIDLPPSWLRGFGQLQGAMALPARRVQLSVDVVYSLLAYLRRHREKTGPRALRFQLTPGVAPSVVLEPFGVTLASRGPAYQGPKAEEVKVWGRRRLQVLTRLLPLTERVEVLLLGSGLPSVWVLHLGEMRFVLALSGWTANDWTSGAALELLAGDLRPEPGTVAALEAHLLRERSAPLEALAAVAGTSRPVLLGSLHQLCTLGQVVFDQASGHYRYRPVLPVALGEKVLGPEPVEVREGKALARAGAVKVLRTEALPGGRTLHQAQVERTTCEAVLDLDGGFGKARCSCSHFFRFRLRAGPCRHLLALRLATSAPPAPPPTSSPWLN